MIITIAVTACASIPSAPRPSVSPDLAWQARKSGLEKFLSWHLNGRIAIKSVQDSWNASIYWQQQDSTFDIHFMTLFGQAVAQLQGHPGLATLQTSDQDLTANDVGELLRKHFGWVIPVEGLRYWVLGIPAPYHIENKELNEEGRLVWLEQLGWHIDYVRYRKVGEIEIPRKMLLEYPGLRVRLIIDKWEPNFDSPLGRYEQDKTQHVVNDR